MCAAIVVGVAMGAGTDLLFQLMENGWNMSCVNWGQVGLAGALGAFGGAGVSAASKGVLGLHRLSRAASVAKYRRAYGITGRGTQVHHGVYWAAGKAGAGWRHSAFNYRALPTTVHQSLHGARGGLRPVAHWWYGTPHWLLAAEGSAVAGGVAEMVDSECGCTN